MIAFYMKEEPDGAPTLISGQPIIKRSFSLSASIYAGYWVFSTLSVRQLLSLIIEMALNENE